MDTENTAVPLEGGDNSSFFEDWDFNDAGQDGDDTTQTPIPAENPQPENVQVAKTEFEQLSNELKAMKQWKAGVSQFFGGQPEQQQPQGDPVQMLKNDILNQVRQEIAVNQARAKYPELEKFEPYIAVEFQSAAMEAAQQGQYLSPEQLIETAVTRFKTKFGQGAPVSQGEPVKSLAMNFDVTHGQPQTRQAPDLSKMSNAEFEKVRSQVMSNY